MIHSANRNKKSRVGFRLWAICLLASLLQTSCVWSAPAAPLATVGTRLPALNWEQRSDWTNIKDLGAIGDGVADDTAAIQKALSGFREGNTLYLPAGTYRVTQPLMFKAPAHGIADALIVGHGRDTRLVWDGEVGATLFTDDGVAYVRYVGLVFDGANKAAIGFWHHSDMRFETEVRYQHCAFLNFTEAGVATSNVDKFATAETTFENCLFDNCKVGASFKSFNDYNWTFSGCEFRNGEVGIEARHGNVYARDCHFANNSVIDMIIVGEHNSSVRRCTSVGSKSFIGSSSSVAALSIQDCHVDSWTDPVAAVHLGGTPAVMFDNVFTNPPEGAAPVRIYGVNLTMISSENRAEGSAELFATGHPENIFKVPAGARKGSITSANQQFLQNTVRIPTRIFDAKRDFGAKGEAGVDDTKAIQATIDAAREHGKDAIAYLPHGNYEVTSTLRITGRDYFVGGSGFRTGLNWKGEEGGTMLAIHDPQNVRLEHINVGSHDVGVMHNGIDIHQTSSAKTSHMTYDGVYAFGMYQRKPLLKGLRFTGLGPGDTVLMPHVQGNLHFIDCAQATILGNATYEGSITVEGKDQRRDGFLGFQTRLATIVSHALYVRDNHNFVASDFYIEQSQDGIVLEGAPGDPPGRITIGGAKLHIEPRKDEKEFANALDIRNYRGNIFFGPYQFYPGSQAVRFLHQGEQPVQLFIAGVSFYGVTPQLHKQDAAEVFTVGNLVIDRESPEYLVPRTPTETTLQQLGEGMDDLRRLGEVDLKLNFPDVLAPTEMK